MTKRILVIEDTEDNRQIVRDLLESAGYELIEALDGLEGVAAAEREHPDLILMDIQLPEVSGLQVTKWIKQDTGLKHIPVVAVTAFAMKGDEEKIREGGCEAYLAKPISVMSFLQTVERFLA
jgi:two-component system, cell cycle response regulator DivK